jgi:hypothetical protein
VGASSLGVSGRAGPEIRLLPGRPRSGRHSDGSRRPGLPAAAEAVRRVRGDGGSAAAPPVGRTVILLSAMGKSSVHTSSSVRYRDLGTVLVERDGAELPVGGMKPATILAMLLIRMNRRVPRTS